MADRTFTEGEAYALVADAVERETAAAKAEATTAQGQVTTLSNEKDALTLRVTAAEEAKVAAETELAEFKAGIETEKANAAKLDIRVAKLAEIAPDLKIEGERKDRVLAMADEAFTAYVADLRQVAAMGPHAFKAEGDDPAECAVCGKGKADGMHKVAAQKASAELPRQSAAFSGSTPGAGSSTTDNPVKGLFAARAAAMSRPRA